MGITEIIIIVVCIAVVLAVGISIAVAKVKGKPSCCSDCAGCPHAKACGDKSGQSDCCCGSSSNCCCDDNKSNNTCNDIDACPYCSGHNETNDNQNTDK